MKFKTLVNLHTNKLSQKLFLFLLVIATESSFSQNVTIDPKVTHKTYKEITKTDITTYKDITSEEILIFGLHLSMTLEQVKEVLKYQSVLYLEPDPFNEKRMYLYENTGAPDSKGALAYLIWKEDNPFLQEIVIYTTFSKYLVGNSKSLLTIDVFDKNSLIVQNFIGFPSKKEITIDLPSIGLKNYSYYYPDKNFKINRYITDQSSSVSLCFFLDPDSQE